MTLNVSKIISVLTIWAVTFACLIQVSYAEDGYKLNPGDQLEVSVWNEEALQRSIVVLPDGMVSLPLVGHVKASGRTAAEVEKLVAKKLSRFIAEPEVSVTVTATSGNVIFVVGQVNQPGPYVMTQSTTVIQALAMAGGLTEFASGNSIKVIRKGDSTLKVRYSNLEKGSDLSTNHILVSGDVIVVP